MSIRTDLQALANKIADEAEKIEGVARHDLNRLASAVETVVAILRDLPEDEPKVAPGAEGAACPPCDCGKGKDGLCDDSCTEEASEKPKPKKEGK